MAVTLGTLTQQILTDANRDASTPGLFSTDPLYPTAIQNAILTAIYFCESRYYWNFITTTQVTIPQQTNSCPLPNDFNALALVQGIVNGGYIGPNQGFLTVSYDEMQSYFLNPDEQGIPRKNSILGNTFYVYPNVDGNTTFNITYYYKDIIYPVVDGQISNTGTSIWFNPDVVDLIRLKAMQRFYHDTLQSPELADGYLQSFMEFERNLFQKNNLRKKYNSIQV